MAESRNHIDLVKIAYKYICSIVREDYRPLIQVDSADSYRPEKIETYIPDILLRTNDIQIIGEAKTISDFDRPHSFNQYRAYFERLNTFSGDAVLVIAVPWQLIITAKNTMRMLKKELAPNVSVVIVNEIGKAMRV